MCYYQVVIKAVFVGQVGLVSPYAQMPLSYDGSAVSSRLQSLCNCCLIQWKACSNNFIAGPRNCGSIDQDLVTLVVDSGFYSPPILFGKSTLG